MWHPLFTGFQTLGGTATGVRATSYVISLRPDQSAGYLAALRKALGPRFGAGIPDVGGGPGGQAAPPR